MIPSQPARGACDGYDADLSKWEWRWRIRGGLQFTVYTIVAYYNLHTKSRQAAAGLLVVRVSVSVC